MQREPAPRRHDLSDRSALSLAARRVNVIARRAARLAAWTARPDDWRRPELAGPHDFPYLLHQRRWPIARPVGAIDPRLEQGKRVNLALAAPHLNGLVVAPDRPLSFWRAVPRPTASRGYRPGMELRGGCVVPTTGGGLCLLSNALFAAAAELGWRILERHGHTMIVDGQPVELDATVLWPHVDLRVAPRAGRARLEVRMVEAEGALEVAVHGDRPAAHRIEIERMPSAEHEEIGDAGRVRVSAVRRVVRDHRGALVEDSLIALDRKRVVPLAQSARSCLSCDRRDCRARDLTSLRDRR
jgi:vancomycin resistance protein VanW